MGQGVTSSWTSPNEFTYKFVLLSYLTETFVILDKTVCSLFDCWRNFSSHSVAADNLEYLMHDIPQSLVPGYILKSLYVLTLLLSPGLGLFPVLSSFPLLNLHVGFFSSLSKFSIILDFLCDICAWMEFSWCCISSILSSRSLAICPKY